MGRRPAAETVIPYHKPHLDRRDHVAIKGVLESGWLTTGKEAAAFEEEFLQMLGGEGLAAVAVSSCTAALHLALALLDLQPGDEVIVPTMTFTATAAAVLMAGAKPIIADVDPVSLNLTVASMAPQITRRTKGLLPVHYGGNPSGFEALRDFAARHGLRLVDDAAHALPAFVQTPGRTPRAIGSGLSDGTCFSFYPTKPLTTGEGGMLVIPKPQESRARRLTLHGIDADAYQRSRTAIYHYEVVEHGWKYNLPDLLAAPGRSQLAKTHRLWEQRTATARRYIDGLSGLVGAGRLTLPAVGADAMSAWHLFPIRLNLKALHATWDRDRVGQRLRELGVGTSMHSRPLHRHKFWSESLGLAAEAFPVADQAYIELLSLPIWPGMTHRHVSLVIDRLHQVLTEGVR
jgi:dTDP-4-amino-4,6-dideoxygalactose transaminase